MPVNIISICGHCENVISKFINVSTSYEADEIQTAINLHDNYSWKIHNGIMTFTVW